VNALLDQPILEALYRASRAGVEIDLIVRGACALRPDVKGISHRIRVRSIVGRFLEHSRIFYFENGGENEIYLGSADWMPRNLYERVEGNVSADSPRVAPEGL
jgi:polyphosphate kinase